MKIIGIDPSLTAPGFAGIVNGRVVGTETYVPSKIKGRVTEQARHRRLAEILVVARDWATGADLVVIEGLAYDGHDTMRQLAGLHWLLRHSLWSGDRTVALVTPSSLKAFATGRGGADKDDMLALARQSFPGVEIGDHNAADALWLAETGAAHLGCPVLDTSAERVTHIQGVTWPKSDLAA